MASVIAAGLTTGTAIAISGDTSGALVLQTNGTTTAVTISTAQVVTLAQPLPVASGGTGSTSTTYCALATNVSGTLPVANGGTGVTTSTGTGAVVLGTSPTLTTPALGTPSALVGTNISGTSNSFVAGIGVNQTWQNVTSSRSSGTSYTNSTGKPIMVMMQGGSGSMNISVGGVNILNNSNANSPATFIVPVGSTYSCTLNAGSFTWWAELL